MSRNERLERLITRVSGQAYIVGAAGNTPRWLMLCRRVDRLKGMRAPAVVAQLDSERLQRARGAA